MKSVILTEKTITELKRVRNNYFNNSVAKTMNELLLDAYYVGVDNLYCIVFERQTDAIKFISPLSLNLNIPAELCK
jgi:hypothetical protein